MSFNLRFASSSQQEFTSYRLLELPPDLLKLVESGALSKPGSLTIKGRSTDDAVLCTPTSTYAIRSITLSNTAVIVTSPHYSSPAKKPLSNTPMADATVPDLGDIVIRDQIHEVLELVPNVAKLDRLDSLLRGSELDDGAEDPRNATKEDDSRPTKKRRVSYEHVRSIVQASEAELQAGMRKARIVAADGSLKALTLPFLTQLLQQILNVLVAQDYNIDAVPLEQLAQALEQEHAIAPDVTIQIVPWFGHVENGFWKLDATAATQQVGIGLLSNYKDDPVEDSEFLQQWKLAVGDLFEERVSITLLTGNYLSSESDAVARPGVPATLRYFPTASLPATPQARFADLFLTRPKWRSDIIAPFLQDIAVDSKDRDKLLLKFCRSTTDAEGRVWYTARAKY